MSLAFVLPSYLHNFGLCLKTKQQENVNGRTTQRNLGRRRRVEAWRRVYFDDLDLYYRVLVTRIRSLLDLKEAQSS